MDGKTNINYDRAAEIAGNLRVESRNMQNILQEMKGLFNHINSGEGTFDGTAANEVRAKFDNFSANFNLFYEAVESYANYIIQSAENYQAVDKASQKAINDLGSISGE